MQFGANTQLMDATRSLVESNSQHNNDVTLHSVLVGTFAVITIAAIIAIFTGKHQNVDSEVVGVGDATVTKPSRTRSAIIVALVGGVIISLLGLGGATIKQTFSEEQVTNDADVFSEQVVATVGNAEGVTWVGGDAVDTDSELAFDDNPECAVPTIANTTCGGEYPVARVSDSAGTEADVVVVVNPDTETMSLNQLKTLDEVGGGQQ